MARKFSAKTAVITAAAAVSLLVATVGASAQNGAQPQPPATITVSGQGQAAAKPDLARIIISVSTDGETIPQVSALNRESSDKIIAKLREIAIPADDIQTVDMQVLRNYASGKSALSSSAGQGFRAEHRIQIVLRDPANVGKIIGDIVAIDNMTLQSVNWDVNNHEAADDQARAAAVADARHRAEIYAQAAGVKLGRLVLIRDESRGSEPVLYRTAALDGGKGNGAMPIIPPASLNFSASAQMVWELAP